MSRSHDYGVYVAALAAACIGLWSSAASAALGESIVSVQADGARMKAQLRATVAGAYTVHELLLPTGTTVREYIGPTGTVFAVSWQGPFKPDLRQLLGQYFDAYNVAPRSAGSTRSNATVNTDTLVLHAGGHQRAFFGMAYDPRLLPAGVDAGVLR